MTAPDIRWKQRHQNYSKALARLESAVALEQPDVFQKAGLIQFFEMSFELAWNCVKDVLEAQGFQGILGPRAALKKGFEVGLIEDGHGWLEALEGRNLTAHTYDEARADSLIQQIRNHYLPVMRSLAERMATLE